jgi:hypothetical protein
MNIKNLLLASVLAVAAPLSQAAQYVEDFEAPFPNWESGWLGSNSNLTNYYGLHAGRGNNPDGLWFGETSIAFNTAFGSSIQSLSFDIASWVSGSIKFYDMSNNLISTQLFTPTQGAFSDPGIYQHFSVNTSTGLSHFDFIGNSITGNTSIDNVTVNIAAVPEPETYALMSAGLGVLAAVARRRQWKA